MTKERNDRDATLQVNTICFEDVTMCPSLPSVCNVTTALTFAGLVRCVCELWLQSGLFLWWTADAQVHVLCGLRTYGDGTIATHVVTVFRRHLQAFECALILYGNCVGVGQTDSSWQR